jgi:hypothetical protein
VCFKRVTNPEKSVIIYMFMKPKDKSGVINLRVGCALEGEPK